MAGSHRAVPEEQHLQPCGNAGAQILRCLQLFAVLVHEEIPQALQLVELCLLQNLPPCVHVRWQHAGAVAQEVEDQSKVLRIPVNKDAPLRSASESQQLVSSSMARVYTSH